MSNEHRQAGTADDRALAAVRGPSHAERARTLVSLARTATLSTIALDPAGFPYGSLVTVAIDELGRPLLLLSTLAEHTANLQACADASVLVSEPHEHHPQPLALGRVALIGKCKLVPDEEKPAVRALFLERHPTASYYVDFPDFSFYRLEVVALRYVGGFGRMSWVTADSYRGAEVDPFAKNGAGIIKHMNEDHADAVVLYATKLLDVPDATAATMTVIDRYGFELLATTPAGNRTKRFAFEEPLSTSDQVRKKMIELLGRARAAT
jgi:putative heme iron utilization protein